MIVQSSLLCDFSSSFTRELILTKTQIKKIVEFPKMASDKRNQVFGAVLQGTCIYLFANIQPINNTFLEISIDNDTSTIKNLEYEKINQMSLLNLYPETYYIPLLKEGESNILKGINSISELLSNFLYSINQGDINLTSASKQFSEKVTSIKLYRGRNVQRFFLNTSTTEYINSNFLQEKVLENQSNTYIVLQEITGTTDKHRLHSCLTSPKEKFLFGHTANKILLKDKELNCTIMGLLNSKLFDWIFRKTSTNNHVMGYEIKQLPILSSVKEYSKTHFSPVIEEILATKRKNFDNDISHLEFQLNNIIYKLYKLTFEEVKIIDPEFSLSKEEYNALEI